MTLGKPQTRFPHRFMLIKSSQRGKSVSSGFSLIEVVLAVGVFAFAVLGLIGLLVPALSSVANVSESNQVAGVISRLDAFLQSQSFASVYQWVASGREKVFVGYNLASDTDDGSMREIVRDPGDPRLDSEMHDAVGPVLMLVLRASGQIPGVEGTGVLPDDMAQHEEGVLVLGVNVYRLSSLEPGEPAIEVLSAVRTTPILSFLTAVNR
jgi:type II secretory pathway pseudopilin PulG